MDEVWYRRISAAAGIAAMILLVVGFLLPGAPPKADDSLTEFSDYLVDKRGALLAGTMLIGLGAALLLPFFSALRAVLEVDGRGRGFAREAFAAGVVTVTINLIGTAILAGAAFEAGGLGDDVLDRAFVDTAAAVFTMAGFPVAFFFIAAAGAVSASGGLPRWTVPSGYVVGLLQLVSTVAVFAKSGFFAAGGGFAPLAFLIAAIWIIAVAVVMLRNGDGTTGAA
jgi:hypothetical protein